MAGVQTFQLGNWKLQSGESILDAFIAYRVFGDPKSEAIIYPSWYSGCQYIPWLTSTSAETTQLLPIMSGSSAKTRL